MASIFGFPAFFLFLNKRPKSFFPLFFKWGKSQTSKKLALYFLASELIPGKRKHRQIKQFCWHHPCQLLTNNVKPSCDQTVTAWRELTKQVLYQINNFICIYKYASCRILYQAINLVFEITARKHMAKWFLQQQSISHLLLFYYITLQMKSKLDVSTQK